MPQISEELPGQWAYVKDWNMEGGIEAPRNCLLVSVPRLIDPGLAPEGYHVLHAYTPATEPYEDWIHLDRGSEEYVMTIDCNRRSRLWEVERDLRRGVGGHRYLGSGRSVVPCKRWPGRDVAAF